MEKFEKELKITSNLRQITGIQEKLDKTCKQNSEVCHPCCVFKLYGEVNSVKNTNIGRNMQFFLLLINTII